jgi:hypothetical protein
MRLYSAFLITKPFISRRITEFKPSFCVEKHHKYIWMFQLLAECCFKRTCVKYISSVKFMRSLCVKEISFNKKNTFDNKSLCSLSTKAEESFTGFHAFVEMFVLTKKFSYEFYFARKLA